MKKFLFLSIILFFLFSFLTPINNPVEAVDCIASYTLSTSTTTSERNTAVNSVIEIRIKNIQTGYSYHIYLTPTGSSNKLYDNTLGPVNASNQEVLDKITKQLSSGSYDLYAEEFLQAPGSSRQVPKQCFPGGKATLTVGSSSGTVTCPKYYRSIPEFPTQSDNIRLEFDNNDPLAQYLITLSPDAPNKTYTLANGQKQVSIGGYSRGTYTVTISQTKDLSGNNTPTQCGSATLRVYDPSEVPTPTPTIESTVAPPAPPCSDDDAKAGKCVIATGLGIDFPTNPQGFIKAVFAILLGVAGGLALFLIIYSGYRLMTSQGNPETIQGARETLTSAIVGLLFIIFSFVILEVIGVDILHIPGFGK